MVYLLSMFPQMIKKDADDNMERALTMITWSVIAKKQKPEQSGKHPNCLSGSVEKWMN